MGTGLTAGLAGRGQHRERRETEDGEGQDEDGERGVLDVASSIFLPRYSGSAHHQAGRKTATMAKATMP